MSKWFARVTAGVGLPRGITILSVKALLVLGLLAGALYAVLLFVPWSSPVTEIAHAQANNPATGRPMVLASAEGAPVLYAGTFDIEDEDGIPYVGIKEIGTGHFDYSYQWIRVDGGTDTNIGNATSPAYYVSTEDVGKLIKVNVSFTDDAGNSESLTSPPFGPVTIPEPLSVSTTLVSNTGQSAATTTTINQQYAMEFTLGGHGQGYEVSSVSIDLAEDTSGLTDPLELTVSLWIGDHSSRRSRPYAKLFDFTNPSSFVDGLNRFTAPGGVLLYPRVNYYIVLTDFGDSLTIRETSSDGEDAGDETGATLGNSARERPLGSTGFWRSYDTRQSVLRLVVEGSRRDSGILISTYPQTDASEQEIVSLGDQCCFDIGLGAADRYLIRGLSWNGDDTTPNKGGMSNPFDVQSGTTTLFRLTNTRNEAGLPLFTAPQGATVEGSKTYRFLLDFDLGNGVTRLDAFLGRVFGHDSVEFDTSSNRDVSLSEFGDFVLPYPMMAIIGEPLYAVVSNLGQTNNGYVSIGDANSLALSQGFTTGYQTSFTLQGIGVNIEGSGDSNGDAQVPDGPKSVAVAVHADSGGKPGQKLFDLVSPDEFAAGHSFFEAPPGTTLEPNTSYVLVWSHLGGTQHRLQQTTIDSEDSGALTDFSIADVLYTGSDLNSLSADTGGNALEIALYVDVKNATGRPVVLASPEGAPVLYAGTFDIEDEDGIPYVGDKGVGDGHYDYSYQWFRVDGNGETDVGTDSPRYHLVDADIGKHVKVKVSFWDGGGTREDLTSEPFGPVTIPESQPASTLVSNTGQSAATSTSITGQYAMEFTLGSHGQGYEVSDVVIDLGAAPTDLTVSLWTGRRSRALSSAGEYPQAKLFDFKNPSSLEVGLNRFKAPGGVLLYPSVSYYIVLTDFGDSLTIRETSSDDEDTGGEPGATLGDSVRERPLGSTGFWSNSHVSRQSVLRLAVEGSRRDSGILFSTYGQTATSAQEIISLDDDCCFVMGLGSANRYLIRGFSWSADRTREGRGGMGNPFDLQSGTTTLFRLTNTRNEAGLPLFTAPQGATVEGSKTYSFLMDFDLGNGVTRVDAKLTRVFGTISEEFDTPSEHGVTVSYNGLDFAFTGNPYMAVIGEPLNAMVSNIGQANNSYHSLGDSNAKVASQGFTTGSNTDGYRLRGIGVNLEGSDDSNGDAQVPEGSSFVSMAVHADANGKPGQKLFDLISPSKYEAGHSFFEAPSGASLASDTSYVMVWTHRGGTSHRLVKTSSNDEDSDALTGFTIADAFYTGADVDNLAAHSGGDSLEIEVYGEAHKNVPGAPEQLVASPHDIGALDLSWHTPDSDGGSDITGYRVQYRESSGSWDTPADVSEETVTTNSHILTGLTGGVEYTLRVVAVNEMGDGPPSAEVSATPVTAAWTATLTVGTRGDASGYSIYGSSALGALSDNDFEVEGSTYTVHYVQLIDGELNLGLDGVPGYAFVLRVGDEEFDSGEATAEMSVTTPYRFRWADPGLGWTDDDQVELSLVLDESDRNTPAAGKPTISGSAEVGEVLTANADGISDPDGMDDAVPRYQWTVSSGSADLHIHGATASSYTVRDADRGRTIRVEVSFLDDANFAETVSSDPTAAITPFPPNPLTGFTVVDASVQPQTVLAALTDGGTLSLEDPQGGSYGIQADTKSGADVGSVRLQLTGPVSAEHTKNLVPYSLHGDNGRGKLNGGNLPVGSYTLTATAYLEGNRGGVELGKLSISFTVEKATTQPSRPLTGFTVVNASVLPQAVLGTLTDGSTLALGDPQGGSYGIRVDTNPDMEIGSVRLQLAGPLSVDHTEGIAPYSLHGDNGAGKLYGENLPVGSYTLTATAYSEGHAGGVELGKLEVSFTVEQAPPLTVSVAVAPPSTHDGQTAFTFEIKFSENIADLSYLTLRDHAFQVTGGQVAKARRMDPQSATPNVHWEITVKPDGNDDVVIVLPVTADCNAQGAICTKSGGKLSDRNELTVSGPGG